MNRTRSDVRWVILEYPGTANERVMARVHAPSAAEAWALFVAWSQPARLVVWRLRSLMVKSATSYAIERQERAAREAGLVPPRWYRPSGTSRKHTR